MDRWRWRLEWGDQVMNVGRKGDKKEIQGRTAKIEGYLRGSVET